MNVAILVLGHHFARRRPRRPPSDPVVVEIGDVADACRATTLVQLRAATITPRHYFACCRPKHPPSHLTRIVIACIQLAAGT